VRIRHVINTVDPDHPNLGAAQALTLASISQAITATRGHAVEVVAVRDGDDPLPVGPLVDAPILIRSLRDVLGDVVRPLPFLADLLNGFDLPASGADDPGWDLGVYTNIDIALQPYFYELVSELHADGHDGFTINRRTVPNRPERSITWLAAQAGLPHPGHDCFVFTPALLRRIHVGDVCVGTPGVGKPLLWGLTLEAGRFRDFPDLHATFHLGNDMTWSGPSGAPATLHNATALEDVARDLARRHGVEAMGRLDEPPSRIVSRLRAHAASWRDQSSGAQPPVRQGESRHQRASVAGHRRRLVFTACSEGSGAESVAALLGASPSVSAEHEAEPTMSGGWLRRVAYEDPARSVTERRVKVAAIEQRLSTLAPEATLVDANHLFAAVYADVVLDHFDPAFVTVVVLHRPILSRVQYLLDHGRFASDDPVTSDWLLTPTAPMSAFPLAPGEVTGRTDLVIGHCLDLAVRVARLRHRYQEVTWIDVEVDRLLDTALVASLLDGLGLRERPGTWAAVASATAAHRGVSSSPGTVASVDARTAMADFRERFADRISDAGLGHLFEETS